MKILIIEDEPALADIYSTKLRMEGFEVVIAGDGVEGLDAAIRTVPNLILLDVLLPIKDGFIQLGAHCFLTKANLTPASIVAQVRKALEAELKS